MTLMATKWVISVRAGTQRKDIVIFSTEKEGPIETYRRVKKKAKQIGEKLEGRATVDIISRLVPFKPRGYKPFNSWLWCPYCGKWRVFNYDDYLGVDKCSICNISTSDFYVKTYNGLWNKGI